MLHFSPPCSTLIRSSNIRSWSLVSSRFLVSNRVDDFSACPKTLRCTCITSVEHSDEFGPQLRCALYQLKYRGPVLLQVERQGETALCRF